MDGSVSSLVAEEIAAIIAKKAGATVTVLYVRQTILASSELPRKVQDKLVDRFEQIGRKILDEAKALFTEEKVNVETETTWSNDPADSILSFSENFDMIVIGTHGEHEHELYELGSVTNKVVRHTRRPTLVGKKVSALANLLIAIDGSEEAINALNYAVNLSETMGAKITLLNVQERNLFEASPSTAETLGEQVLSKARDAIINQELQIEKKLGIGVPSNVIIQVAEKGNYDLVVLGNRGLGTVKRFLLGSVSDNVIQKAQCSVLIVPTKK